MAVTRAISPTFWLVKPIGKKSGDVSDFIIRWNDSERKVSATFRCLLLCCSALLIVPYVDIEIKVKVKVKKPHYMPGQALRIPGDWGSQISRQSAHGGGNVVSPTHRPPLAPENISGTHLCWRLSRLQGHSADGRIMSMKNSSDTIGNRTRDLPACRAVPHPTTPPHAPLKLWVE